MAAFVPANPITGQPVATSWGQDVHKRIYTPLVCQVNGNIMTGISGAERALSIDGFIAGNNMLDNANDVLVIPAGGSGLYRADITVALLNMAQALGNFGRCRVSVNGSAGLEGVMMFGIGSSSVGCTGTITWVGNLADGATFGVNVIPHATVIGDYVLRRMTLQRIGNSFGTVVLREDGTEAPPERPTPTTKGRKGK